MAELKFKTAGIRGILGRGIEFLNSAHILRIIEAYAKYLLNKFPEARNRGVVIGRDNRIQSYSFARQAAMMLVKYKIKVHYIKKIAPTPFISFCAKRFNAVGAINITASHNPKEYNGMKLYDPLGVQLLPKEINLILPLFKEYKNYQNKKMKFVMNSSIKNVSQKIITEYEKGIVKIGGQFDNLNNVKIAYSPQHGTGSKYTPRIFKKLNMNNVVYEKKQMIIDKNFTYCKNPNPESKQAFELLIELGKKEQADILLTTDPDADRVGLAVHHKDTYQLLNGNEIAILIFNYLIETTDLTKFNYHMIYSFVSSNLPMIMAKANNITTYKTETGFKWIGNLNNKISNAKKENKLLFAFEESYGSLINDRYSGDKDALQSIIILTKMASYYKNKKMSLLNALNNIYKKYGYAKTEVILVQLDQQNLNQLKNLKTKFRKLKFEHSKFLDYSKGLENIEPNDMLSFYFENNSWVSLRPSGTEPKAKIYIFSIGKNIKKTEDIFQNIKNKILNIL